jgi:L-iditol 2-dehydrogenase
MMNSLVWTGPRQMELKRLPVPAPGPGEALLQVTAAGICGSELSGYLGHNSLRKPPLVMGHEFAGTVAALGAGPSALHEGQLVTVNPLLWCRQCDLCLRGLHNLCRRRRIVGIHCPGAFAEFVLVPQDACNALNAGVTAVTGALAEPLACSLRAWEVSQARVGDAILIMGAGTIGLALLAVARQAGAAPIVVADINPGRLATARRWGAETVINPREADPVAAVLSVTEGRGVESAFDCVGSAGTRTAAVRSVRPGGRAVFVGLHEAEYPLPTNDLVRSEVQICGSFAYTGPTFDRAVTLLTRGLMPPDESWLSERPLAAGQEAFEELLSDPGAVAKIMLRP